MGLKAHRDDVHGARDDARDLERELALEVEAFGDGVRAAAANQGQDPALLADDVRDEVAIRGLPHHGDDGSDVRRIPIPHNSRVNRRIPLRNPGRWDSSSNIRPSFHTDRATAPPEAEGAEDSCHRENKLLQHRR